MPVKAVPVVGTQRRSKRYCVAALFPRLDEIQNGIRQARVGGVDRIDFRHMVVLWQHPMGKNLIAAAGVCLLLAHFVISKIVDIEV